jgi:hypothetical protein
MDNSYFPLWVSVSPLVRDIPALTLHDSAVQQKLERSSFGKIATPSDPAAM